jgi:hypothetical protein
LLNITEALKEEKSKVENSVKKYFFIFEIRIALLLFKEMTLNKLKRGDFQ